MLAFVFELFIQLISQGTGHGLVYVCTLGQVRCGDDLATIVGIVFLLALLLLIGIVTLRN